MRPYIRNRTECGKILSGIYYDKIDKKYSRTYSRRGRTQKEFHLKERHFIARQREIAA